MLPKFHWLQLHMNVVGGVGEAARIRELTVSSLRSCDLKLAAIGIGAKSHLFQCIDLAYNRLPCDRSVS